MTRDQIIAKWNGMTPRERDVWVAEVVFGWNAERIADAEFAYEIGVCGVETVPYYTEDIAAAWTVLTHNGVYGAVSYMGDNCRAEVWARWNPETDVGEFESAISNSETEAICLAALFANLITPTV